VTELKTEAVVVETKKDEESKTEEVVVLAKDKQEAIPEVEK